MKLLITVLLLAVMSVPAFAAKQEKVDICHFDKSAGVWELININSNSVEQHSANHDDGFPGEATDGSGTELDENCEVVVCPCWADASALSSALAASRAGLNPPTSCADNSRYFSDDDYYESYGFIGDGCGFDNCGQMNFTVGYDGIGQPDFFPEPIPPIGYWCVQHDAYDGPLPPSITSYGISERQFAVCQASLEEFATSESCP